MHHGYRSVCGPRSLSAGHTSSNVAEAVRYSEESRTKCIGLTIETRPDYCLGPHLSDMLSYGCTRLEIGLQVCCPAAGAVTPVNPVGVALFKQY